MQQQRTLVDNLRKFLDTSQYCDLTLTFGGSTHTLDCHKVVLAAGSPYFRDNFLCKPGAGGDVTNIINIDDVSYDVMKEMMTYMYNGECHVTDDNVVDLLRCGIVWQVAGLAHKCEQYVVEQNRMQTLVQVFNVVSECADVEYISSSSVFERLQKRAFTKKTKKWYPKLSLNSMAYLLASDKLCCTEEQVFEFVLNWMKSQDERVASESCTRLFSLVRYQQLSREYMCDVVLKSDHLRSSEEAFDLALRHMKSDPMSSGMCTLPKRRGHADSIGGPENLGAVDDDSSSSQKQERIVKAFRGAHAVLKPYFVKLYLSLVGVFYMMYTPVKRITKNWSRSSTAQKEVTYCINNQQLSEYNFELNFWEVMLARNDERISEMVPVEGANDKILVLRQHLLRSRVSLLNITKETEQQLSELPLKVSGVHCAIIRDHVYLASCRVYSENRWKARATVLHYNLGNSSEEWEKVYIGEDSVSVAVCVEGQKVHIARDNMEDQQGSGCYETDHCLYYQCVPLGTWWLFRSIMQRKSVKTLDTCRSPYGSLSLAVKNGVPTIILDKQPNHGIRFWTVVDGKWQSRELKHYTYKSLKTCTFGNQVLGCVSTENGSIKLAMYDAEYYNWVDCDMAVPEGCTADALVWVGKKQEKAEAE